MRPGLSNSKSWTPRTSRRDHLTRTSSNSRNSDPRSARNSPHGGSPPRARSPSLSPRPSAHLRRKSSHWDFDLPALERSIDSMDPDDPEFEKTAAIFMAARWAHIRAIRNVLGGEDWVYKSDWIDYWGSSKGKFDPITPAIAGQIFDILVDKRRQGRVSMREMEKFAKTSQRVWRGLAAKGERSLSKFSWWEEQQDLQLRRQISLDISDAREMQSQRVSDTDVVDSVWEKRSRSERNLSESRVEGLLRQLQRVRADYEREVNALMDKNARLMSQHAEMKARCVTLEEKLKNVGADRFCNIPEHRDVPRIVTPTKKMLPRAASFRQRTVPDLFEELKLEDESNEDGVRLVENEEMRLKKSVHQVQVEASWLEAGDIDVDVDLAASLFDSQKRFVRHVMWGPRADRTYRRGIITLHEDVRSGGDEGEKMDIFLDRMPIDIQYIVVTTTIFQGATSFQDVAVCDVKVRGSEEGTEEENSICHFKLSGASGRDCNAVVMALFARNYDDNSPHDWSFHAIGKNASGTKVADILPTIQDLIDDQE